MELCWMRKLKNNWKNASKFKISPKVIFDDYFIDENGFIYPILINEAYDSDLSKFYQNKKDCKL